MMLHQFIAFDGPLPGRRFFEMGRRLAGLGHRVTVITGNSGVGLALNGKKLGLLQREGVAVIAFDLKDRPIMSQGQRRRRDSLFAYRAVWQGRRLPPPDVVLASSPPFSLADSAFRLSAFYGAPLILEIREMEKSLVEPESKTLRRLLQLPACRRALQVYGGADYIISPNGETAAAAAGIVAPARGSVLLDDDLGYEALFQEFSRILAMVTSRQRLSGEKNVNK